MFKDEEKQQNLLVEIFEQIIYTVLENLRSKFPKPCNYNHVFINDVVNSCEISIYESIQVFQDLVNEKANVFKRSLSSTE